MSNIIKGVNKLEGASNYRSWKKRIDLILEKNKVLDLVKGNVKKPTKNSSDEIQETRIGGHDFNGIRNK